MNSKSYETKASEDCLEFRFDSISDMKTIKKVITFTRYSDSDNIYNLAFGDLREDESIDDLTVSNNADMEKVIATVVHSVYLFFQAHPKALVYIEGSTSARTRLYRIVITRELSFFKNEFDIFGRIESIIEPFARNRPYDAFVINLKP